MIQKNMSYINDDIDPIIQRKRTNFEYLVFGECVNIEWNSDRYVLY